MMVMSAGLLGKDDLAIGFSHSGATLIVLDALALARRSGARTIAVTNYLGLADRRGGRRWCCARRRAAPPLLGENAAARVAQAYHAGRDLRARGPARLCDGGSATCRGRRTRSAARERTDAVVSRPPDAVAGLRKRVERPRMRAESLAGRRGASSPNQEARGHAAIISKSLPVMNGPSAPISSPATVPRLRQAYRPASSGSRRSCVASPRRADLSYRPVMITTRAPIGLGRGS